MAYPTPSEARVVLLLLFTLAATAAAGRQRPVQQAPAVGRQRPAQQAAARSDNCRAQIPACAVRNCPTRVLQNKETFVCPRCLPGFVAVQGSDGTSAVQCVCPAGTYQVVAGSSRTCSSCPIGSFCPGGVTDASLPSFWNDFGGDVKPCNPLRAVGLTTRAVNSSSINDCVALGGYVLPASTGGPAQQCTGASYAPALNQLRQCLQCPPGLGPPASLTGPQEAGKQVCQVPPGKYLDASTQALLNCPQGTYRPGYARADAAAAAAACIKCPYGSVTRPRQSGSASAADCMVPPGYFVRGSDGGAAAAGEMVKCPTTPAGSTEEGYYRSGWARPDAVLSTNAAQDGRDVCSSCGQAVLSSPRDPDESPAAPPGSFTPATSASCYIRSGEGLTRDVLLDFAESTWKAIRPCPANSFGAAADVFGLAEVPCTQCGFGLGAPAGSSSAEQCKNRGGYGYRDGAVYACPAGTWAAAGSMQPCQPCPAGRTSSIGAAASPENCIVLAGFGVYAAADGKTVNPWTPVKPTSAMQAKPCPQGFWSQGDELGGTKQNPICQRCIAPESTTGLGSSSCDACVPGYGKDANSSQCTACTYGSFQSDIQPTCESCSAITYANPLGDGTSSFASYGISFATGAKGHDGCVPRHALVSKLVGDTVVNNLALPDAMFTSTLDVYASLQQQQQQVSDNAALQACLEACPVDACCIAEVSRTSDNSLSCRHARLSPVSPNTADGRARMFYKLPPSDPAAHFAAQDYTNMASGTFAVCDVHSWREDVAAGRVGNPLGMADSPGAGRPTFDGAEWNAAGCMTVDSCKQACMADVSCWGFVWSPDVKSRTPVKGGFALRAGDRRMQSASFFVSPDGNAAARISAETAFAGSGLDVEALQWQ